MNFTHEIFPPLLYWFAHPVYLLILAYALYTAPWERFKHNESLHVFLGGCVAILFVWQLKAGIHPGLNFHLLGATLMVLMLGCPLALIGASLVLFAITFNGASDWGSFSLNALIMVVVPVTSSYLVYRLALRYLPHHFFIYTIFDGYFTGALVMFVTITLSSLLLISIGPYTLDYLFMKFLPFAPMMIFAEGFFTGMLATSMALFRPEWLVTYDDKRYIVGK